MLQMPQPSNYLSPLSNIMPAMGPVIDAWGNAFNEQAGQAEDQLRTRMMGSITNAGLAESPAGMKGLGTALGRQSGQFLSGYTGQLLGLIPQLGSLAEGGANRQFTAEQAALAFQRQKELQNLGLQNQLTLAQKMGPIDAANYDIARQTAAKYPQGTPQGIGGAGGMGTSAGMPTGYGSSGLLNQQQLNNLWGSNAYATNQVTGQQSQLPNQVSGTQAAGMPGGVDYNQRAHEQQYQETVK